MTPKKKPTKPAVVEEQAPAPRFAVREQGANFQIIDTTNGYVHALTGAQDEADAMAASLNDNPPEEPSATD